MLRDDVKYLYQAFLGREPESSEVVDSYIEMDVGSAALSISQSEEVRRRAPPSWFYSFYSTVPVEQIVRSHANRNLRPRSDRLTNFLGVTIDPAYVPSVLEGMQGQVESAPIPGNWHADMAEWAGALRAVDLSAGTFRAIELGCGWGCWLLNTGVVARSQGKTLDLIGVEGDRGHIAFAEQALRENHFDVSHYSLYHAIVGPRTGKALFPKQDTAGSSWGLEPLFDVTDAQAEAADANGYYLLPTMTLASLAGGRRVDLLHIDIQGGEAAFVESCAHEMDQLVAYTVIGTHSRLLEGTIFEQMLARGWVLEIERPAVYRVVNNAPVLQVDGVQAWRNPRLT